MGLVRTVVLVGLMGAGKTNVGSRLASRLGVPFFDSDLEVEAAAGMCVADIFSVHGEAAFRDAERKIIRRLLDGEPHVLATGGGAYMNSDTREAIAQRACSLWLRASLPVLLSRTSRSRRRPLLANGNAETVLRELIEQRHSTYSLADVTVDSDGLAVETTTQAALEALIREGIVTTHDAN